VGITAGSREVPGRKGLYQRKKKKITNADFESRSDTSDSRGNRNHFKMSLGNIPQTAPIQGSTRKKKAATLGAAAHTLR